MAACVAFPRIAAAQEPPVIPTGLDAYRQWDRWPYLRVGQQTFMRSTYDRRGGNEGADASHFLFQLPGDRSVPLDLEGPGVINFIRYNHWHGSPWHYLVDSDDFVLRETTTADPNHPQDGAAFVPAGLFPEPLAFTWATTRGADLIAMPIPFTRSFQMQYERTHYGTGYYIFTRYLPGARLSKPLRTWEGVAPRSMSAFLTPTSRERDLPPTPSRKLEGAIPDSPPSRFREGGRGVRSTCGSGAGGLGAATESGRAAAELGDVLILLRRSGTDIAPKPDSPEGRRTGLTEHGNTVAKLDPGYAFMLTRVGAIGGMVRGIQLSVPVKYALDFGRVRLRITWDGRRSPSVDAPIALFFGAGTLYNRDNHEYLVKAFPVNVRYADGRVNLACWFPMPFFESAKIEIAAPRGVAPIHDIRWSLRVAQFHGSPDEVGYFHATYRDFPNPPPGRDLVLLDTRDTEGGGDWSGHLVGTSFIFSHRALLGTLEGDPRFYFDDSSTPQVQGTGTEEWGGGGDYWGGQNMTLPFFGHPTGARSPELARSEEDKIESAYRFLLGDLMPFGRNARICLEHGGTDESTEHYETVAYWYGQPRATLRPTDELFVGDAASERAHAYASPTSSEPVTVHSRYEWGVDHLNGVEIYPEETDTGRTVTGTSEFTLAIDPRNVGVALRRKLDYSYPNQRAEVFVADASAGAAEPAATRWRPAGVWYLAGSNTCVYSNPKEELGPAQHVVQTSNRRFRDDDFLLPRDLTKGRSAIRVRVRFTPVDRPLFPGQPVPPLAWSEIRYTAFCYLYGVHR